MKDLERKHYVQLLAYIAFWESEYGGCGIHKDFQETRGYLKFWLEEKIKSFDALCFGGCCAVGMCGAKSSNWFCTRPKDHEGNHIACGNEEHDFYNWA